MGGCSLGPLRPVLNIYRYESFWLIKPYLAPRPALYQKVVRDNHLPHLWVGVTAQGGCSLYLLF